MLRFFGSLVCYNKQCCGHHFTFILLINFVYNCIRKELLSQGCYLLQLLPQCSTVNNNDMFHTSCLGIVPQTGPSFFSLPWYYWLGLFVFTGATNCLAKLCLKGNVCTLIRPGTSFSAFTKKNGAAIFAGTVLAFMFPAVLLQPLKHALLDHNGMCTPVQPFNCEECGLSCLSVLSRLVHSHTRSCLFFYGKAALSTIWSR